MSLDYIDRIERLGACPDPIAWLRSQKHPGLAEAWEACTRADWMLWLVGRVSGPVGGQRRAAFTLAVCECAELILVNLPAGEDRPRLAITAARQVVRGQILAPAASLAADEARRCSRELQVGPYAVRRAALTAASTVDAACSHSPADVADVGSYVSSWAPDSAKAMRIVRRLYPEPPILAG